ncbi:hypothetical protein U4E84_13720 [Halorubrum sp. AD140]|uniref:RipA family octameric membrane protein n=1 Tax=Halorubrum sp. AD140 TaxID=3050073 RepID=UPI002ACD197F|nr:hypothetical protein [Halorubrum sp. AD140]MDZ5812403.1 hypothetical protein [Halorubrum sp. AD140]
MTNDDSSSDSGREKLIDQYTAYVNTTLNVSNRRMRNNRFYVLLLSGTLAVLSVLTETQIIEEVGLLLAGLLGLALCILWYLSIVSYKQLNSGKYDVLATIEKDLPAEPFNDEWEVLDEGQNWRTYITHTRVERKIPGVLAVPYLLISIYASIQLL